MGHAPTKESHYSSKAVRLNRAEGDGQSGLVASDGRESRVERSRVSPSRMDTLDGRHNVSVLAFAHGNRRLDDRGRLVVCIHVLERARARL